MTSATVRVAYRLFRPMARRAVANNGELSRRLLKARIRLHPEAYVSFVYFMVTCGALFGALFAAYLGFIGTSFGALSGWWSIPVLAFLAGLLVYLFMMTALEIRVEGRARRIESSLPYALNFISSMASAGVIPHKAFGALSRQAVYGAVAEEAAWIFRDVEVLGKDIVTALMDGSHRSASREFGEFLQGTVSTVLAGGNLQNYFLQRAEQAAQSHRRDEKAFVESLGVMAESYVVTAAAGPLFLIVIISIMTLISVRSVNPLFAIYIVIFLLLPVVHTVFASLIRSMRPEV